MVALALLPGGARARAQGPPYQTGDPVPVDLHHYEFYIFGGVDGTTAEIDSTGPAFEFNWGAIPRVQLHAILPWGVVAPSNNPAYLPGGVGPTDFGLTDTELGAKIAFLKERRRGARSARGCTAAYVSAVCGLVLRRPQRSRIPVAISPLAAADKKSAGERSSDLRRAIG